MNTEIFKLYPFNKIERWIVDSETKSLIKRLNPENSNFDENFNPIDLNNKKYDIATVFPSFYVKKEKTGDETKVTLLHDQPRTKDYHGYSVDEAFINEDGTVANYVVVGSFLASEFEGKLKSQPFEMPISGRSANEILSKGNVIDEKTIEMIKTLSMFVLQSTSAQTIVGPGHTTSSEVVATGTTMELGNSSGSINNHISLFGIEDFYGNLRTICSGIELKESGLYVKNQLSPIKPLLSDGYISKTNNGSTFIPKELNGTESSFYNDWYETQSNWININSKTSGVLTVKDGEIKSKGLSIEGKDTVLNLGNGRFKNEEILSGVVKSEEVYVGRMQNETPEGEYGQFQITELENIGEVTSISTVGESQVFQHENGTVIVEDAILNNSDVTNLPDPRVSMMFGAGPEGLEYWNSDYDKMPIKTINMAGLQKWEETDDYIIYLDKDAIVTTVQNYVPGTFDLFNERKSQIEAHAEMLKMYEVEWTPEDSEKLLLDINNEQLERIASTPTTMDEPAEIQTFSARAVPTTYECCFRTDKKSGEIYIGEGYENYGLLRKSVLNNLDFGANLSHVTDTIDGITIDIPSGTFLESNAGTHGFLYRRQLSGFAVESDYFTVGFEFKITEGKTSVYNHAFGTKRLDNPDTVLATSTFNNFGISIFPDNIKPGESTTERIVVKILKHNATKTSTPKPFVKSVMPSGKLSFVTNATSETHSFLAKDNKNFFESEVASFSLIAQSNPSISITQKEKVIWIGDDE